jgi:excisionase family DNA binding protein
MTSVSWLHLPLDVISLRRVHTKNRYPAYTSSELLLAPIATLRYPSQELPSVPGVPEPSKDTGQKGAPMPEPDTDLTCRHLLNVSQVKEVLGTSRSTVYRLMDGGVLISMRIGRARRVRVDDLITFLDADRPPET